jgi:hypothetical protein
VDSLFRRALSKMAGAAIRLHISYQGFTRGSPTFTREVGKSPVFMQTTIREVNRLHKRYKR